jgi:hypothetical protein
LIRWQSWHRWTAICLLAYLYLAVTVAVKRQQEADLDLGAGLILVTGPELLRLLRDTVIPPTDETERTDCTGRNGDAAISTAPARPTGAGTPMPKWHHDHNELQLPYQSQCKATLDVKRLKCPDCGHVREPEQEPGAKADSEPKGWAVAYTPRQPVSQMDRSWRCSAVRARQFRRRPAGPHAGSQPRIWKKGWQ